MKIIFALVSWLGVAAAACCEALPQLDMAGCAESPQVAICVCKFDGYCCNVHWDQQCADEVYDNHGCDAYCEAGDCSAHQEYAIKLELELHAHSAVDNDRDITLVNEFFAPDVKVSQVWLFDGGEQQMLDDGEGHQAIQSTVRRLLAMKNQIRVTPPATAELCLANEPVHIHSVGMTGGNVTQMSLFVSLAAPDPNSPARAARNSPGRGGSASSNPGYEVTKTQVKNMLDDLGSEIEPDDKKAKTKLELAITSVNGVKAGKTLTSIADGVKGIIKAVNDKNPAAGLAAGFQMVGTFAALVPGGQGVAVVMNLLGTIFKLFSSASNTAKIKSFPTIGDITNAVKSELWQHDLDTEVQISLPTQADNVQNIVRKIRDRVNKLAAGTLTQQQIMDDFPATFNSFLGQWGNSITAVSSAWNHFNAIAQKRQVTDPDTRSCLPSCFLLVSKLDEWKKNPTDPSYNAFSNDAWSPQKTDNFDDIPLNNQLRDDRYRLCFNRYNVIGTYQKIEVDGGCEKRVRDINDCKKRRTESFKDFKELEAFEDEIRFVMNWQLMAIGSLSNLLQHTGEWGASKNQWLEDMKNDMQTSMGRYFGWGAAQAKKFDMGGETYDCDATDTSWTKYAGGPSGGYQNGYLKNQPCVTKPFCDKTKGEIGACNDPAWHCDPFDVTQALGIPLQNANKVDYTWRGPAFDYKKAVAALSPENQDINVLDYLN